MWHCPKCIRPQTLLDQTLQFRGFWEQSHFEPYTQLYQYTSVMYKGVDIGLHFNAAKSRVTIVKADFMKHDVLECTCGAKQEIPKVSRGTIFYHVMDFFTNYLKVLPAPKIESCETFVRFAEGESSHGREDILRDYILRHIRGAYLDKRGADHWLLWYRP